MVRRDDEGPTQGGGVDADVEAARTGWQATLQDMRAMAADREEKGFYTLTLPSHNTAPVAPADGDDGRCGLSHLLDSEDAEEFVEFYEGRDFTDTGVYQFEDAGNVLMVTEHIDYDNEQIIFIAGAFRMVDAGAMVKAAYDRGSLQTYVRTLDEEIIGVFDHDDPSAFFPDPDAYYALGPDI